jgi:2-polyprenyl-6-methoxyphenol hydroxylase-like FAD-dependent oxidoreductase
MSATGRVGIVGGSIGGCAAAVSLSRRGWDVDVFERSNGDLVARGAGIATVTPLLDALVDRDLIDSDMPRFAAGAMRWVGRDGNSPSGRVLGTDPGGLPMSTLTWRDLYTQLRRRMPPAALASGRTVTAIEPTAHGASLHLADGSRHSYDLVVCADGARSLGRSTLFPEAALSYRGYVLWRGLVPQRSTGTAMLEDGGVRCGYLGGHGVFYLVPSTNPDLGDGACDVNWGLYLRVPEAELAATLTDRLGRRSNASVAAGMLDPDRESALKAQAGELLPEVFAQIVEASRNTFIQAIFTARVHAYHGGRVCLVGDAGTLHPPFTGSGVLKAIINAVELAHALGSHADVEPALAAWNEVQLRTAASFAPAAEVLERAFIFDMPDLAELDHDAFTAWNSAILAELPAPRAARADRPPRDAP